MIANFSTKPLHASCPRARCAALQQQARRAGGQVASEPVAVVVSAPFLISGDIRGRMLFSKGFFRCVSFKELKRLGTLNQRSALKAGRLKKCPH
jgi:hypothetical protein